MLIHDFYQVSPKIVQTVGEEDIYKYIKKHANELKKMSISDKVVLRNLGRTDTRDWNILECDKNHFSCGKMRYFSCFISLYVGNKIIGLDYYGITIMNHETLKEIIDNPGHVRLRDTHRIKKFQKFCKDACEEGKWIVHWGV